MIKLTRKPDSRTPASTADAAEPSIRPRTSSVPQQRREERFFTVKQLAARWQISERQVHRFIESGALTAHRIGRSLRIAESDVLLFEFQCR
jgi:excisionase family DNA binding protein